MKKSILILPLVFVFLFASCTASVQLPLDPGVDVTGPAVTETAEPAPEETQAPEPTQVPEPTPYVIVNGSSPIVYPAKMELSEEEQEIADRCYELFKQEYPLFADTPRELIREYVHTDDYLSVTFIFCLGGYSLYNCQFSTSPRNPKGEWSCDDTNCEVFHDKVLTEDQVAAIKSMLFDSVSAYIDEYHLDKGDLSLDKVRIYWQYYNDKLTAEFEQIAYVTADTTKDFGCGDHAHVFGLVQVDFTENGIRLTDLGARGS